MQIDIRLDPHLPQVSSDRSQIEQVITNLMLNARDAMDRGGTIRVGVGTARTGTSAAVTVEDDGPGISEDIRERIFEPFFTTKGQGLGLGLALCRSIVERYHGRIQAEHPEVGCRFIVSFPGNGSELS